MCKIRTRGWVGLASISFQYGPPKTSPLTLKYCQNPITPFLPSLNSLQFLFLFVFITLERERETHKSDRDAEATGSTVKICQADHHSWLCSVR